MQDYIKHSVLKIFLFLPLILPLGTPPGVFSVLFYDNLAPLSHSLSNELAFKGEGAKNVVVGDVVADVTRTNLIFHTVVPSITDGDNVVGDKASDNSPSLIDGVPTISTSVMVPRQNPVVSGTVPVHIDSPQTHTDIISQNRLSMESENPKPILVLLLDKLSSWGHFERNLPMSEVVDTRDPVLLAQIEELAFCESSGRENIKILDTNGWYSHGCLQFQFPTFKQYCKRYGILPGATDEELLAKIGDCSIQKDLAYRIISESPDNWAHWAVCSKKIGAI
jgi:hypothetical protein